MGKGIRYFFTIVAIALAWMTAPALADKRVALVVGNGAYRNVATLPNPANDAADIAAAFERLGFSVKWLGDASFEDMRRGLIEFGRQANGADMAVVYFAGHGMEIGGENWLIPVDAELRSDTDAENEAVSLRSVILQVSRTTKLGLVILDACRNNPFSAKMARMVRTRAVDRGLTRVEPADNVLVAYASKDGTTANDGTGRNSPFTAAVLRNMERPGLEISFMFRNIRDEVMQATKREQQPFVYGSLSSQEIYLKPPEANVAAQPVSQDEAARVWQVTRDTHSVAVLQDFIRQFGGTSYEGLARARLDELKKTEVAVASPPPPPPQQQQQMQPQQAPPPVVDPRVVGTWVLYRGRARWIMHIFSDGTYQFRSDGPGAAAPHEGTLKAIDKVWVMRPTRGAPRNYVDGGSYELRDASTMAVNGNNGLTVWKRASGALSR